MPESDVVAFRDLLIEKVGAEMTRLEAELAGFIESPDALSLGNVASLVALIATKVKLPGRLGVAVAYVLPLLADAMSELADGKLEELHEKAKAKHDFLTAVLTGFQLDLNDGVDQRILLSSNK